MSEDPELDEIRRRKLMELQQAQMVEQQQHAIMEKERAEIEAQRQMFLRTVLQPDARERLARVRMTHPQVAEAVEEQLLILAQNGRLTEPIDDNTMKKLLAQIAPKKKETKITFK